MNVRPLQIRELGLVWWMVAILAALPLRAQEPLPKACIDGEGPGWQTLTEADFVNVNCDPDTWTFGENLIRCTGKPVGVIRTRQMLTNFELVVQWKHLQPGGNSGVFLWATPESIQALQAPQARRRLPDGIEVQILDHAFKEQYLAKNPNRPADWFTTHGDVFPTGSAKLTPFPPTSPNGSRSFPRKELSRPAGQWNHYYVRAINGEVRLWVNGEEVSGGTGAQPATGYLCLESEGAPIEFRNLRLRVLP